MIPLVNSSTANLAANLGREGRQVLLSPLESFGTLIPVNDWATMGLHPVAEKIAPTTDIQRATIVAQDPEGGVPLTLREDTTGITAIYESIAVLTPDDVIRGLHVGSVPMALTGTLVGGTISPFAPGAGVLARMIVIRRRKSALPDPLVKVYWHPRVSIQNNGEGDDQDQETLVFRIPIQAYTGGHSAALSDYAAKFDPLGAIFTIPASKLDALLTALDGEAAAVVV